MDSAHPFENIKKDLQIDTVEFKTACEPLQRNHKIIVLKLELESQEFFRNELEAGKDYFC